MRLLPSIPAIAALENSGSNELHCAECDRLFDEHEEVVFWTREETYRCEACSEKLAAALEAEAKEFARQNCKITKPLPKLCPLDEFRCTPEEYERGEKESYTRNSHLAHCRHNCTNYDDLIKDLSKHDSDAGEQILYDAIRDRIEELLTEQIDKNGDDYGLDDEE